MKLNKPQIEQMLLAHSSGFIRDGKAEYWALISPFPKQKEFKDLVKNSKLVINENAHFKYSNLGYTALGLLIEKLSGLSYQDYMDKHILKPLKLSETRVDVEEEIVEQLCYGHTRSFFRKPRTTINAHLTKTNAMNSATGFCSNAKDLCKFTSFLFEGNNKLVSDSSKRELFRIQLHQDGQKEQYGLGFRIFKIANRKLFGHAGGFPGYITNTVFDPEGKLSVSVLVNAQDGPAVAITDGIVKAINYHEDHINEDKKIAKYKLKQFCTRVYNTWGANDIIAIGNKLIAIDPGQWSPFDEVCELEYKSENKLKIVKCNPYDCLAEELVYKFGSDKKVEKLYWGGHVMLTDEEFFKEH